MYTEAKVRLNLTVDSDLDMFIRRLAADYRRPISEIHEEVIRHCLKSSAFKAKLADKYKKDPEY